MVRTRSGDYKKYAEQTRKEVMVQMSIEPFVSGRAIRDLLSKTMPDRKYIDRYVVNNIRIGARNKKVRVG